MANLLETATGRLIDVENPDPLTIHIDDIAWGLSRSPRFCGHTITVIPYNNALHSIFVADEVDNLLLETGWIVGTHGTKQDRNNVILKALLHDAPEVFTGDLPSPIKKIPALRPIIKQIENNLMSAIYQSLNLEPMNSFEEGIIKRADRIAQKVEAHAFMVSRGKDWPDLPEVSLERLQQFNAPLDSLTSYKLFMEKFNSLLSK